MHESGATPILSKASGQRRRGRPPSITKRDMMNVTMRLRKRFWAELKDFAKAQKVPPGEIVMTAVQKYVKNDDAIRQLAKEPRRRLGRPPSKIKKTTISVRIPMDVDEFLNTYCNEHGILKGDVIAEAVTFFRSTARSR